MNKKLLFGIMSLAALAACTNDDFENQGAVAEQTSPIQFEVINNDASMRATMNGSSIVWSANDGDLFTLYHGGTATGDPLYLQDYQNATYKAGAEDGKAAKLTTPSMILAGKAIMTWPVDTMFTNAGGVNKLAIQIPTEQTDIANQIPYVSDLIDIDVYNPGGDGSKIGNQNTAGYQRTYPVFMRPMASQLTLKAEYAGKDKIDELVNDATDPIADITIDNIELQTVAATAFTKKIALTFTAKTTGAGSDEARWNAAVPTNAWSHVTRFDIANIGTTGDKTNTLTSACPISGEKNLTNGCKFLILPQATIGGGVSNAAVTVNTYYGKVLIAKQSEYANSKYSDDEYNAAWYRYVSEANKVAAETTEENASAATAETTGENAGKYKTIAKSVAFGMQQTINDFSTHTAGSGVVKGEPVGYALTRYVNVDLTKLDMSELHIKTDKQLRDVAKVWKKLGLDAVTVYLDGGQEGDATGEFTISQKTIEVINGINGAYNATTNPTQGFTVKPCKDTGEECTKIIITGSDYKQDVQDIAFIVANGGTKADVVLAKETKAWKWNGTVKVAKAGVNQIVNKGTMENGATATLKTVEFNETQNSVKLRNEGTWNITAGTLNVQFDVTNIKEVNISKGAQYRQDGAVATYFTNTAVTLPQRFLTGDAKEMIGVVNNYGVFASVNKGGIVNYGLIEHADKDAKTYILRNQQGGNFDSAFDTSGNRMGRINLKYSNKDEDNISISAAAAEGFVSVTVNADDAPTNGILNADVVGDRVNYIIVNGGINEIAAVSAQVKYIEINDPSKKQPNEIVWSVANSEYEGLIVLSDVNIKLNTTINVTKAAYLGADMYVGGTLKYKGGAITDNLWKGYYGDTSADYATKYITY